MVVSAQHVSHSSAPADQISAYPDIPFPPSPVHRLPLSIALDKQAILDTQRSSAFVPSLVNDLFPKALFPITPNAIVKLCEKAFYDFTDQKWLYYPDSSNSADCMECASATANFLNKLTRICWLLYGDNRHPLPEVPRRWSVTKSPRLLADGSKVASCGIALAEAGPDDTHWRHVLCDVQIESTAKGISLAVQKLTTGAAHVFATQEHRLFHLGLALAGDVCQLAYFDRAGRVLSPKFNVHKHPVLFARAIMGLTVLDRGLLGFDPSIIMRDGRRFLEVSLHEYEIVETIHIKTAMLGRGTVCWRCRCPDDDEDFVIKSVWVDEKEGSEEGALLMDVQQVAELRLEADELVLRPDGKPYTTTRVRESRPGEKPSIVPHCVPRLVLRRMVFQPYARPLRDFSSKEELLGLMLDALKEHEAVYEDLHFLHGNINDDNIRAYSQPGASSRRGMLIDFAGAIPVSGKPATGSANVQGGTSPFTACDVLLCPRQVEYGPWHDFESFLYVLMIICATCSGPSNTPRQGFDIRKSPMAPWYTSDGNRKADIMYLDSDAKFRAFLDRTFDPYFDDLKDVVCELRTLIMFRKNRQPTHVDVMAVFYNHIRARQANQARTTPSSKHAPLVAGAKHNGNGRKRRGDPTPVSSPSLDASAGAPRGMTTRAKSRAAPPREPSPASDESDHTVVQTPPRRKTRASTKCAQSDKQTGMATATRAAKRRKME
ncbi:hypothetical protein K525DRAFT_283478 [Schizophyllum commune Loenen D]|nr:hypothetical protein K525DRAFT_283478 [Schizophyllum commune Loenen D]